MSGRTFLIFLRHFANRVCSGDKRPKVGFLTLDQFLSFEVIEEKAIVGKIAHSEPTSPLPNKALQRNVLVLWTTYRVIGDAGDIFSKIVASEVASMDGRVYIDSAVGYSSHNSISPRHIRVVGN